MTYKTELHCHTREVSKCGKASAEETANYYAGLGYSTVVLTEHFNKNTWKNPLFAEYNPDLWEDRVRFYMTGIQKLEEAAAGRFHVLLGCEFRMLNNPSDFQLYGVTGEFLLSHPELPDLSIKELSPLVREAGILLVQAHPFRDGQQIAKPELLDGIEVWNSNLSKDERNDIAEMWAERYGLIKTSGTDYHCPKPDREPAGILTDFPIESNEQLLATLRGGNYSLIKH